MPLRAGPTSPPFAVHLVAALALTASVLYRKSCRPRLGVAALERLGVGGQQVALRLGFLVSPDLPLERARPTACRRPRRGRAPARPVTTSRPSSRATLRARRRLPAAFSVAQDGERPLLLERPAPSASTSRNWLRTSSGLVLASTDRPAFRNCGSFDPSARSTAAGSLASLSDSRANKASLRAPAAGLDVADQGEQERAHVLDAELAGHRAACFWTPGDPANTAAQDGRQRASAARAVARAGRCRV